MANVVLDKEVVTPVSNDWATIVSLVPLKIEESKPGLNPGFFFMPPAVGKNPQILHIGESHHHVYLDDERGYLPISNSANKIAKSIVFDYANSQLGISDGVYPAIFWIPGKISLEEVKLKYSAELEAAWVRQLRWFEAIVRVAQDDWARYQKHAVVSDFQRIAAVELRLNPQMNPWMQQASALNQIPCPACSTLNPANNAICKSCHCVLDEIKASKLKFVDLSKKG